MLDKKGTDINKKFIISKSSIKLAITCEITMKTIPVININNLYFKKLLSCSDFKIKVDPITAITII